MSNIIDKEVIVTSIDLSNTSSNLLVVPSTQTFFAPKTTIDNPNEYGLIRYTDINTEIDKHDIDETAHADIRLIAETAEDNSEAAVATANEAKSIAENAESVALGIDAKASEALENSKYAVDTADEAKAIALSKTNNKSFDTYAEMIAYISDVDNKEKHTVGSEFFIAEDYYSEYWVKEVLTTPNESGYYYVLQQSESTVWKVNGQTGEVVLKTDDISDTDETNKFATAEELSQIATNAEDIIDLQDGKVDKEFSSDYAFTEGLVVTWKSDTNTYRVGAGTTTSGNGYTGTATEIIIPKFFDDGVHGIAPVVEIGTMAFWEKTAITSVKIPDSVTSIEEYAFHSCTSLTTITIPNGVTSIGSSAFYNCPSLTSITIPDSVTSIGYAAFYDCTSLTEITIPNGVTSIGGDAFYLCSSLTEIAIPDSVTSIGYYAFYACTSLTNVIMKSTTPPTLGIAAFNSSGITATTGFIYVPYASLTAYKEAPNWSTYADRIFPIPEGKWIKDSIDGNTASISSLNTNKADKATTLTGYGITDAYTKTEIESKIASVYKYKGSVANYASLPTDNLTIGDVYNVEDTGDNYAWTGSEWDKLAGTVDLSGYATTEYVDSAIQTAIQNSWGGSY